MKQFLSVLLAIATVLSTVSFAAPMMVGTVDSAAEVVLTENQLSAEKEEKATVAVEDLGEEVILKEFTFDTDAEGWYVEDVGKGYSGGIDGNGLFTITSDADCRDPRITNKSLSLKTQYVTKIEVKVKKSCTDAQNFQIFYMCNGGGAAAANMVQKAYSTTDEWNVLTFETSTFTGTWEGRFTGMRLDAGNIAQAVYSLDYIRIYGYVAPVNFKPGYNMLTGTEDAMDFDDLTNTTASDGSLEDSEGNVLFTYNTAQTSTLSVVDSPVAGETGKSLMFSGYLYEKAQAKTSYELYPQLYTKDVVRYEAPEDGRPVLIKYDIFSQKQFDESTTAYTTGATSSYPLFRDKLNGKGNGAYSYSCYAYNESPAWTHAHVLDENSGVAGLANIQLTAHLNADGYNKATNKTIGDTSDDVDVVRHYMDNIGYYPYYKVTYMNGNSVVDTKWVLADANGNLLKVFNPAAQGVALPEGKVGWSLTKDGVAAKNIPLENKDIIVYAVDANFRPGINILTGTEELQGFENLGEISYDKSKYIMYAENGMSVAAAGGSNIKLTVDASPVGSGKALKLYDYTGVTSKLSYTAVHFETAGFEKPSDSRPVFITFDTMLANADNTGAGCGTFWVLKGNDSSLHSLKISNMPVYNKGAENIAWGHYFAKDSVTGGTDLSYIQFQYRAKTDDGFGENEPNHYFDNIGYYPYYKVTYMNGDSVVDTKWILDDGNGNILESFSPANQGVEYPEGKNGWALTDGGEKVDEVALENKDIVLYAVAGTPDSNDELLYAYEFNDENSVNYVYAGRSSIGVAYEDGNAVVNSDVFSSAGNWDTIMYFRENSDAARPKIKIKDIKRIALRIRPTQLDTYTKESDTVDETTGEKPTYTHDWSSTSFESSLAASSCQIIMKSASSAWLYPLSKNYRDVQADEDGYYIFDVNVTGSTYNFDEYVTELRLDGTNILSKWEVDYVRIYGNIGAEFTPVVTAPQKREGYSLRVDNPETTGVRFKAAMSDETRENKNLTEYGWIVALADTLGTSELTHQFESTNGKKSYVTGKSYGTVDGNKIDKIYETEEGYKIFTAVITGIPADKADKYLVVRPYSVIGGAYVYGESRITSPREVGQKIYNKWVDAGSPEGDTSFDYVKYQDYIDTLGIKK